jgi:2-oxoacid:acceptor oxidoreductase gamma subunit (pyruvate/2-ketoisovalerate family)/2-oxoacid:acceptor oxidoreductase delta subunit (pyruvate/2-ketoisovalerate family)
MQEILIVGRGGEGVVVASQILAETFTRAGLFVQSFPEFTAERRGAPISAYVRWGPEPVHRRHKMQDCDVLVAMSPSPPPPETLARVRSGGLLVLNRETRYSHTGDFRVARVAASRIARSRGIVSAEGRPMANTALLGACVALVLPEGLPFLEGAIACRMGALAEPNVLAARDGYARCVRQRRLPTDARLVVAPGPVATRRAPLFPVSTTDSRGNQTGTWSLERPAVRPACTGCAVCVLFCPEGAISRSHGGIVVDYRYCKGCGICEVVCPVAGALELEEVAA